MSGTRKITKVETQRWALLPASWRAIADGSRVLSDLDDEEVQLGRLRDVTGRLGPKPTFYPQVFIDEQVRRALDFANDNIREGAREAMTVLREIMNNNQAFDSDRIKAATIFIDRFLGKDVQRVLLSAEDPVETLFRQILADPEGLSGGPIPKELSADERELLS